MKAYRRIVSKSFHKRADFAFIYICMYDMYTPAHMDRWCMVPTPPLSRDHDLSLSLRRVRWSWTALVPSLTPISRSQKNIQHTVDFFSSWTNCRNSSKIVENPLYIFNGEMATFRSHNLTFSHLFTLPLLWQTVQSQSCKGLWVVCFRLLSTWVEMTNDMWIFFKRSQKTTVYDNGSWVMPCIKRSCAWQNIGHIVFVSMFLQTQKETLRFTFPTKQFQKYRTNRCISMNWPVLRRESMAELPAWFQQLWFLGRRDDSISTAAVYLLSYYTMVFNKNSLDQGQWRLAFKQTVSRYLSKPSCNTMFWRCPFWGCHFEHPHHVWAWRRPLALQEASSWHQFRNHQRQRTKKPALGWGSYGFSQLIWSEFCFTTIHNPHFAYTKHLTLATKLAFVFTFWAKHCAKIRTLHDSNDFFHQLNSRPWNKNMQRRCRYP